MTDRKPDSQPEVPNMMDMADLAALKIPDSFPPKLMGVAVVLATATLMVSEGLLIGLLGLAAFGLLAVLALFLTSNG